MGVRELPTQQTHLIRAQVMTVRNGDHMNVVLADGIHNIGRGGAVTEHRNRSAGHGGAGGETGQIERCGGEAGSNHALQVLIQVLTGCHIGNNHDASERATADTGTHQALTNHPTLDEQEEKAQRVSNQQVHAGDVNLEEERQNNKPAEEVGSTASDEAVLLGAEAHDAQATRAIELEDNPPADNHADAQENVIQSGHSAVQNVNGPDIHVGQVCVFYAEANKVGSENRQGDGCKITQVEGTLNLRVPASLNNEVCTPHFFETILYFQRCNLPRKFVLCCGQRAANRHIYP